MTTPTQATGDQPNPTNDSRTEQPAVDMIRQKIDHLYVDEPNAKEEIKESVAAGGQRSKHQDFMYKLSTSGSSLAEIQTQWHNYYVNLPDNEKHEVWQEFYSEHDKSTKPSVRHAPVGHHHAVHEHKVVNHHTSDPRTAAEVKEQIISSVAKPTKKKLRKNAHIRSLLFGLSMGAVSILILLFGFFNERFIAPFISPSKSVSNTPIVIDPSSAAIGPEAKIIIPKINVEIPVVYDQQSIAEKDIEKSLEEGVVHYASTSYPGEKGNGVIFGHSSNNILNKGKYKFAFVLLKQLDPGDTFYLQKDGKRYIYKVAEKKVVKPTDVSVLYTDGPQPTMTLVTCDPPGTSLNRLLVIGNQISPDPSANVASTANRNSIEAGPTIIPSNSPSLWQRFKSWITS